MCYPSGSLADDRVETHRGGPLSGHLTFRSTCAFSGYWNREIESTARRVRLGRLEISNMERMLWVRGVHL